MQAIHAAARQPMRAAPRITTGINHQPTLATPLTTALQPPARCTVKISSATPITAMAMLRNVSLDRSTGRILSEDTEKYGGHGARRVRENCNTKRRAASQLLRDQSHQI